MGGSAALLKRGQRKRQLVHVEGCKGLSNSSTTDHFFASSIVKPEADGTMKPRAMAERRMLMC